MSVTVVRYRTKPDRGDENQALIEKVFQELKATQPEGLRYTSFRLEDGVSFVHVAIVDTPDGSNPLGSTAAFKEFTSAIAERCEAPPAASSATEVGHYFPGAK
ncbi:MAG TPA: hypothetical protein VH914_10960 [Acidimicrobiia bacterium]|jgi:hypothetical protein|nr:hypothetical protein [Acidimicrobiia bacterium]